MYKNEKVFKDEKNVKYVFHHNENSDALVIVFSSFQELGKPPAYNYGRTIEKYKCSKLFILDDFGARASYYLCENRDFSIERSVLKLINKIIEDHNIKTVITAGSSKGGYAALYYGLKYDFDYVISGSPQYLLGNYLIDEVKVGTEEVYNFMAGTDIEVSEQRTFLNNIMKDLIKESKNKPNIFIHLGKGEKHYRNHVKYLLSDLEEANLKYELDLGDYDKHSGVAKFFPPILRQKIQQYLKVGKSPREKRIPFVELHEVYPDAQECGNCIATGIVQELEECPKCQGLGYIV